MLEKLKKKWELKSNWDLLAIIIVFSISGSSIMFVRPLWFKVFGVTDATPTWLKVLIWLAMVFPTYQAFLLIYGFIFGQFKFFWAKEKKMALAIGRLFKRKSKIEEESIKAE
jgi:uncharacterized protein DUF6787